MATFPSKQKDRLISEKNAGRFRLSDEETQTHRCGGIFGKRGSFAG